MGSLRSRLLRADALRSRTRLIDTMGSNPTLNSDTRKAPFGAFRFYGGEGGMGSLRSRLLRADALRSRTRLIDTVGSNPTLNSDTRKAPFGAFRFYGGEGGIRTHGTRERTPDFESGPFGLSGTSPENLPSLEPHRKKPASEDRLQGAGR